MPKSISIAVPHPQLYILDTSGGDIPEWEDKPFLSTPSCVMFRCMPSIDGDTKVTLGIAEQVTQARHPISMASWKRPGKKSSSRRPNRKLY